MCTLTTANLMGFFMEKRYILTGYYERFIFRQISQTIAESNDFEELETILENLIGFNFEMDIYDSFTNQLLLSTTDYAPPKQK